MRAVLYGRVSGDDSKYATSGVDSQLEDCRAYANGKGYEIVGEFFEERNRRTSGQDMLPEIKQILELAAQDCFDILVIREVDRLARNQFKHHLIKNYLDDMGVKIEYVLNRYEDTDEGDAMESIAVVFAELELKKIVARLRRGRINSVKAGNISLGGSYSIFGYDLVNKNDRRQLIINELEAQIVRLIFDLYGRKGYTIRGITAYLTEHNIAKPGKGRNHKKNARKENWNTRTVGRILANETYVGRWYYRKTRPVKNLETGKVKHVPRPKSEWLMIETPPIVDQELFDLAQRRRDENKRQLGKQHKRFYLLGGMLLCGLCGSGMFGLTNSTGQVYYKCNAHHQPKRYGFTCDSPHFRVKGIDTAVWDWVKSVLTSPEKLNESLELHQEKQLSEVRPLLNMIEASEAKLESVKEQKERLIESYTKGVLSLDEIAQRKVAIDTEIEGLTAAIASYKAELNPKLLSPQEIQSIKQWTKKIKLGADVITKYNPEKVRGILQQLQTSVTLVREGDVTLAKVRCVLGEKTLISGKSYALA